MKPKIFILDVDGVMTDGKFYYSADGKIMKIFGSDDHDALSLLKPHMSIHFVTGDHRGFEITKARIVDDMKMPLDLVSTIKRIDWIKERWNPNEVIYMGDGIFDHYVFKNVSERAVAEASLHILEKFFVPYNPDVLPDKQIKFSGEWTI